MKKNQVHLQPEFHLVVHVVMTTKPQTMNTDQLKHEMIRRAQAKLKAHESLGMNSNLSLVEVAQLRDIIAGNVDLQFNDLGKFFGLHSLN
ncbi:MAG: hypothetical protein IPM74_07525 [Crocinitomicaceae bacterium]|nr:hypothetical protein [Crocinitomicaceae bacterium]MBK8925749.1 hypothetical protein [Crocinitomicaceae bacterium]